MSELKPCPFHTCDTFGTCGCYDTLYMRDKDWNTRPIEDALTARIAELEAAQRWIPVSERLPELRVGRVDLVYTVYGEIHSAMYLGNGWTSLYRDFRSNEVTHWMPLPSTPEVQE